MALGSRLRVRVKKSGIGDAAPSAAFLELVGPQATTTEILALNADFVREENFFNTTVVHLGATGWSDYWDAKFSTTSPVAYSMDGTATNYGFFSAGASYDWPLIHFQKYAQNYLSFLYGIVAFAPADPARDAGMLRTPDAIRAAQRLFARAGVAATIPRDTDPAAWAAKVLEARARADRLKEEARVRRVADREDERREAQLIRDYTRQRETGRFNTARHPGRRGGYH